MGKIVTIDTEALGISWQPNRQYRIAIDQGFVKEDGNNQSPNPANTNLNTFTTNGNDMVVSTSTPTQSDTNNVENATITLGFSRRIQRGTGDIELYQVGSPDVLLKTYATATSTDISLNAQTLSIDITGLQLEGESYYLLGDAGSIKDRDGFDWVGFTATTDLPWTNSTGPEFPSLSANLLGAFVPTMSVNAQRVGDSFMSASFSLSAQVTINAVGASTMSSQITQNTVGAAVRDMLSSINTTAQLSSDVIRTRDFAGTLPGIFSMGHPYAIVAEDSAVDSYQFESGLGTDTLGNLRVGFHSGGSTLTYGAYIIEMDPTYNNGSGNNTGRVTVRDSSNTVLYHITHPELTSQTVDGDDIDEFGRGVRISANADKLLVMANSTSDRFYHFDITASGYTYVEAYKTAFKINSSATQSYGRIIHPDNMDINDTFVVSTTGYGLKAENISTNQGYQYYATWDTANPTGSSSIFGKTLCIGGNNVFYGSEGVDKYEIRLLTGGLVQSFDPGVLPFTTSSTVDLTSTGINDKYFQMEEGSTKVLLYKA